MKDNIIAILCIIVLYLVLTLVFTSDENTTLKNRAIESNCAKYIVDEKTGATQFVFKGEEGWIE